MNEPLKCGPSKKCIKMAQEMLHEGFVKEITENSEAKNATTVSDKDADAEQVRAAKQEPQPGTSHQEDDNRRISRQSAYTPWANGWSTAELQTLQLEDPDVGPILQAKLADKKPDSKEMVRKSPACRHYWILWDMLTVRQGLLFKKFVKKDGNGDYQQFIVPRALKKDIMFQMHDSVISGHLGCKKPKRRRSRGSTGLLSKKTSISTSDNATPVKQTRNQW